MSVCRSSRHLLRHTNHCFSRNLAAFHHSPLKHNDSNSPSDKNSNSDPSLPILRSPASIAAEKRNARRKHDIKNIKDLFVPYSPKELKALSQYYTDEQMDALKAAEDVVSLEDLALQWGPRKDQWKLEYEDDLAHVDPLMDYQPQPQIGHAPPMHWRGERRWAPEELEWSARDGEIEAMSEADLKQRYDQEFDQWSKDIGMNKLPSDPSAVTPEEHHKIVSSLINGEKPSLFDEEMDIYTMVKGLNIVAQGAINDALRKSNIEHPIQTNTALEEFEVMEEALTEDAENDLDDPTKAFKDLGPFTYDDIDQMQTFDMPEDYFVDHEIQHIIPQSIKYKGLGITEMLYKIEKSKIADEIKASLRPLYTYKGTHKEEVAKQILWPFVTDEKDWSPDPKSYRSIRDLFEVVQTLKMDPVKKAELLAYSHWANTPKGDSLRPVLERAIDSHNVDPVSLAIWEIEQKKRKYLGLDMIRQELPIDVEGPNKHLYSNSIYSALNPPIPRIRDPSVTYTSVDDDARSTGLRKVSQETGFTEEQLRKFRTKNLVFHRVVNQTRKGKIQSMYALSVAGNEDGLLGIGEGKAFEAEDAIAKAQLQALRNIMPVPRYEKRTIFGQMNSKVGGSTVTLMSRPPGKSRLNVTFIPHLTVSSGFGVRTQSLIYEVARCAGIRDLAARVGRSRNKMNTVKATYNALMNQPDPEEIAMARGRKLVDVRKVYYGQTVS